MFAARVLSKFSPKSVSIVVRRASSSSGQRRWVLPLSAGACATLFASAALVINAHEYDADLLFVTESVRRVATKLDIPEREIYSLLPHLRKPVAFQRTEEVTPAEIASMIDHTVLKPKATAADIKTLCEEAEQYRFAAVCVNGSRVPQAVEQLLGSNVRVAAVVGFPLGATSTAAKREEAIWLISRGVSELDMVLNVGMLCDGDYEYVLNDIAAVVKAARWSDRKIVVKVILESSELKPQQIADATILALLARADFVKTSTGFAASGGAKVEDVALMRRLVGDRAQVKASGGVRSMEDAVKMIQAGATRLGTSSGVQIVKDKLATTDY
eukprot:TRINITY_DN13498_c0_g1_i1.p1 TRINITY_DN13498_c0_g1~~TRINITY_DN13498_c0_g1_i1.p1  ORF type:complete len:328 (+),score=72.22 TRINITY_DN13498_c0_g1_i1:57-1040(+)